MKVNPDTLRALITVNAGQLNVAGTSLNAVRLLSALATVETDFGAWCVPRHEDNFCPNRGPRSPVIKVRHRDWGCTACCSWSPWQILYHSAADFGYSGDPVALQQPEVALPIVIKKLNKIITRGDNTVELVADSWNSGNSRDTIIPKEYITKVKTAYEEIA